ncbi:MAG: 2Fe-2S iron-sulfur cluster binding domain-containing protein [Flavobacteriaceae bacterium]|jgi:2Fe-2S ferredoxin|nr:2Fe-2S iron-sulfur cluster binding domain-containing protein [Flavobacteriaceae bacterium]
MSDVSITIIDREGQKHKVEAPTDMSMNLMELIRAYELVPEGTIGICGGMAMCASCQIYIINPNTPLPEKGDEEEAMLSEAFFVKENSRLGCQIPITEELDGLEIQIAPES